MNENQPTQKSQRMSGIVNRLNKMIAKHAMKKYGDTKNQTKQQSQLVRETQLTDK